MERERHGAPRRLYLAGSVETTGRAQEGAWMPVKKKIAAKNALSRPSGAKIVVENVNVSGYTHRVDALMYAAMRTAMLKMLPRKSPGMTQGEMWQGLTAHVPRK